MNSYLIVSDLHDWDNNIANRINYINEINYVKDKISYLVDREISKGNNPTILFLGDINHRGFKNIDSAIKSNNFYVYLSSICEGLYSVIGNHEITYRKNNPFWTLMTKVDCEYNKQLEPKGEIDILNVVDELTDGEVTFYFNHYGMNVTTPSNKINILLSHNNISTKEIIKMTEQKGREFFKGEIIDFEKTNCLNGYSYVYLGHQHSIFDTFYKDNIKIQNLASLGRTNRKEVDNNFLERMIPIVRINNGKLEEIEDYKFNLPREEDCLDVPKIQEQIKIYESKKDLKYLLDYKPSEDSPIKNLIKILPDFNYRLIIDNILQEKEDEQYLRLKEM